jgi:predicted transcriptional regulator
VYQSFNLDAYAGQLVSGVNTIAVGLYNTDNTSSDMVFDGELVVNNIMGDSLLFTGDAAQAHSVNTTGWSNGEKTLKVTADDAVCLTPLLPATGSFHYKIDASIAGITVTPTSGLVTTEAGGTATFTIVLKNRPRARVIIDLNSSDTTEGKASPTSLTFTTTNWNKAQKVIVKGVDDFNADGDQSYKIITHAAVSTDSVYNGMNAADVLMTNSDNETPGVTVNPTSGLTTTEAGGKSVFTIVLNRKPRANVTIDFNSSDTTEGSVSPSSVTFTTINWNKAQKVIVSGSDDLISDGNQPYTILTHPATSTDSSYNGLNAGDVSVINNDNDMPLLPLEGFIKYKAAIAGQIILRRMGL